MRLTLPHAIYRRLSVLEAKASCARLALGLSHLLRDNSATLAQVTTNWFLMTEVRTWMEAVAVAQIRYRYGAAHIPYVYASFHGIRERFIKSMEARAVRKQRRLDIKVVIG